MTIYLPRELYQTLLDMAYKEKKSISEYIREKLTYITPQPTKTMNGGSIMDLGNARRDLVLEEAWEKLENLRKLVYKLENIAPSQKMTLKYYELKQIVRKNAVELIDYITGNKINDEKLIREATSILKKINNK
jgi:hypothetical protein